MAAANGTMAAAAMSVSGPLSKFTGNYSNAVRSRDDQQNVRVDAKHGNPVTFGEMRFKLCAGFWKAEA